MRGVHSSAVRRSPARHGPLHLELVVPRFPNPETPMAQTDAPVNAAAAGTVVLGGDMPVVRMGFGAMRITGAGIWGPPKERDECLRVLRRAVELGVTLID